jgi:hypothetical protein
VGEDPSVLSDPENHIFLGCLLLLNGPNYSRSRVQCFKIYGMALGWWLLPVTLAIQEAEVRRVSV